MIQIEDTDKPIQVAAKIINATKICNPSPVMKAFCETFIGTDADAKEIDMFFLEEIKEIADYLMVFYITHKDGD